MSVLPGTPPGIPPGPTEPTAGPDLARPRPPKRTSRRPKLLTGDWALDLTCAGILLMGFNRWRVGEYPLSDFVFVAAGGVIVVRLLTGRARSLAPAESRRSPTLVLVGALIMLTAGTLSSFGAWNPLGSVGIVLRLAWLTLLWFWIQRSVATGRAIWYRLLSAWILGLLIHAAIATSSAVGLTNFTVHNNESRQTAFFGHPNDLAGYLVVGLPLIVLGLPRDGVGPRQSLKQRAPALGLVAYALAASGSMSAVVGGVAGLAATFAVLFLTRNRRRSRRRHPLFVMLAAATVALGLVWVSTSDIPLVTRISELNAGDTGVNTSVESRGVRNRNVTDRFDELLLVGIGLDYESGGKIANVQEGGTTQDVGVHNMYLKVLLESGLPGLIGLWLIIGTTFVLAWRLMINLRDDPLHPAVAALFGSMVTINVFAMFQPTLFHRYYWMPFVMIGTLWAVRRQELRQARPVPAVDDLPRRPRVA